MPTTPTTLSPPLSPRRHIASLDGMRGVAVLAVMAAHAGLLRAGGLGVDVFFGLSGYLITSILLDERERFGRVGFGNFYMRRFLRLAPALWLLVALYIPATKLLGLHVNGAVQDSGMAVFYISNWTRAFSNRPDYLGHTWSLAVEEQFYLLWPPVVLLLYRWLGRGWRSAAGCLACAVLIAGWRIFLRSQGAPEQRVYNGLDTCSDPLLLGAALAFSLPRLSPRIAGMTAAAAAVLLLALFAGYLGGSPFSAGTLTAVLLVGLLNGPGSLTARLFSWTPLAWTGKISYGLYLYHFPIMAYLTKQGWPAGYIALSGGAAFILATMSYYGIERPCLRLKDLFRPAVERGRGGAIAVKRDSFVLTAPEVHHAAGN